MDADEHKLRTWEAHMSRTAAIFAAHISVVSDFAALAIKSIILINGAAAAGVLAFIGSMWGTAKIEAVLSPALNSIEAFAWGAFAAVASAGLSYFSQFSYAAAEIYDISEVRKKFLNRIAVTCHVIAITAAIVGMIGFICGAYSGIGALKKSNGGLLASTASTVVVVPGQDAEPQPRESQ